MEINCKQYAFFLKNKNIVSRFILGYRNRLNFLDCLRSLFLLHNETINIWSHLLGFAFFAGLFVHDLVLVIPAVTEDGKTIITKTDFLVLLILLICYQVWCLMGFKAYSIF